MKETLLKSPQWRRGGGGGGGHPLKQRVVFLSLIFLNNNSYTAYTILGKKNLRTCPLRCEYICCSQTVCDTSPRNHSTNCQTGTSAMTYILILWHLHVMISLASH